MSIVGFDDVYLTREQRRLLGGWRDIMDDLRRLCKNLNALPDACTCGQGASHLAGSCPCCHHTHDERVPACDDCDALLAQLRPAIDTLIVDTTRFFPIVKDLLKFHAPPAAQPDGASVVRQIGQISRTFSQLVVAADEFRAGCRTSHLHTLKERATELQVQINELDRRLEGPTR